VFDAGPLDAGVLDAGALDAGATADEAVPVAGPVAAPDGALVPAGGTGAPLAGADVA